MESLVPANTKKSTLIMGMFRPIDFIIGLAGIIVTIFLIVAFPNSNIWIIILCCLPMFVCVFLVLPLPNYHNVLCGIQSVLSYYNDRRNFIWKGWCAVDEYDEKK